MTVSLDELKLIWQFLYNTEVNQSKKFPQLIMLRDLFRQLLTQKNWSKENEKFKRLVFQFDSMIKTLNSNDINNSLLQKISDDLHEGGDGLLELARAINDLPIVLDRYLAAECTVTSNDSKLHFENGYISYQNEEYNEAAESFALALQALAENHEKWFVTFVWLAQSLYLSQSYEQLLIVFKQYGERFKSVILDSKLLQEIASILNFVGTHFYLSGNLIAAKNYYQQGYELCLLQRSTTPNELELQLSFNFITSLLESLSPDDENIHSKVDIVMNFLIKYQVHYLSNIVFLKNVKEDFIDRLKSMGARFFSWQFFPQAKYCYHLLQAFSRLDTDELSLETVKFTKFMLAGIQLIILLETNDDIEKNVELSYQFFIKQSTEHYQVNQDIFLEAIDFGLLLADLIIEISEKKLAIDNKYLINILNTFLSYEFSLKLYKILTQIGNLFVKLTTQNIFSDILTKFLKIYQKELCSLPSSAKNNWLKAILAFAKREQNEDAKKDLYKAAYEIIPQTPPKFNSSEEKNLVLEGVINHCQILLQSKNYKATNKILITYIGVDLNDVTSTNKNNFLSLLLQLADHYHLTGKKELSNGQAAKTVFVQAEKYLAYLLTFNERPINQLPTFFEMLVVAKYIETLLAIDKIAQAKNFLAPYKKFTEKNIKIIVTDLDESIKNNLKIKGLVGILNRAWSGRQTSNETANNASMLETTSITPEKTQLAK